jgi:hypothetical protein
MHTVLAFRMCHELNIRLQFNYPHGEWNISIIYYWRFRTELLHSHVIDCSVVRGQIICTFIPICALHTTGCLIQLPINYAASSPQVRIRDIAKFLHNIHCLVTAQDITASSSMSVADQFRRFGCSFFPSTLTLLSIQSIKKNNFYTPLTFSCLARNLVRNTKI